MKDVYIVAAVRTPMGSFGGSLASVSATKLAATAFKGALDKSGVSPSEIQEVFLGNVLQANAGQAPAKQAAIFAGLGDEIPCTTINKVCASGMKAIALGAASIMTGDNEVVMVGGAENMSSVPYYLDKARTGYRLGDGAVIDGLVKDGLTDVYNKVHMGVCAELCAEEHSFSREDQDKFAIESYTRAANAWKAGKFANEIVPVEVEGRRGDVTVFAEDEEYKAVNFDKLPTLRPVFKKDGTVTAANASTLNDGASALILVSKEKMEALGLKPLAKIVSYADAAQKPELFTTAPAKALPIALKKAGLSVDQIDSFELNEAFSVVGLANCKLMNIPAEKCNINGGAVALGHPLGSSGSRIIVTLINVLKQNGGKFGAAGICNGGGGASAMVIENID